MEEADGGAEIAEVGGVVDVDAADDEVEAGDGAVDAVGVWVGGVLATAAIGGVGSTGLDDATATGAGFGSSGAALEDEASFDSSLSSSSSSSSLSS